MGARNLYDPEQNVDAGVKYIKYLDKRFNGDIKKIIAAYNGGEGNVQRYKGVPPFRETRQYVKKVMKNYDKRTRQIEHYEKKQVGGSVLDADGTVALR
jgi:soluble lytic murein transglycosylase-like protein